MPTRLVLALQTTLSHADTTHRYGHPSVAHHPTPSLRTRMMETVALLGFIAVLATILDS